MHIVCTTAPIAQVRGHATGLDKQFEDQHTYQSCPFKRGESLRPPASLQSLYTKTCLSSVFYYLWVDATEGRQLLLGTRSALGLSVKPCAGGAAAATPLTSATWFPINFSQRFSDFPLHCRDSEDIFEDYLATQIVLLHHCLCTLGVLLNSLLDSSIQSMIWTVFLAYRVILCNEVEWLFFNWVVGKLTSSLVLWTSTYNQINVLLF